MVTSVAGSVGVTPHRNPAATYETPIELRTPTIIPREGRRDPLDDHQARHLWTARASAIRMPISRRRCWIE
jgi:hypothetical protein